VIAAITEELLPIHIGTEAIVPFKQSECGQTIAVGTGAVAGIRRPVEHIYWEVHLGGAGCGGNREVHFSKDRHGDIGRSTGWDYTVIDSGAEILLSVSIRSKTIAAFRKLNCHLTAGISGT
jgi:hypothetical protein